MLKSHWNQGIGKRMMCTLIEFAKQAPDTKSVHLEVRSDNHVAIHLYIINKLNQNPDINILSVIIPLGNYLENGITYYYNTKRDQEINYIKNQNKIFNKKCKPDFTKVLPIDVFVVEELRHIARMEPANRNPVEIYNVINKDIENFPFVNSNYIEEKV